MSKDGACECLGWARTDGRLTDHHPDCEQFEELRYLKVACHGGHYTVAFSGFPEIVHEFDECDDDLEVTLSIVKMTKEEYERLPEFNGF